MLFNKKGAIELSFSTIIIIAIGAVLLILGLVFVRNIFASGTDTINLIDKNTQAQINALFNQDENMKTIIYLANKQADVKKGSSYNLAFGIKNIDRNEVTAGKFSYQIIAKESGCKLDLTTATNYIKIGKSDSGLSISPGGEPTERKIVLEIPATAPLCLISYDIAVTKDGQPYDTNQFILNIIG
jgi:hypothetical protein